MLGLFSDLKICQATLLHSLSVQYLFEGLLFESIAADRRFRASYALSKYLNFHGTYLLRDEKLLIIFFRMSKCAKHVSLTGRNAITQFLLQT